MEFANIAALNKNARFVFMTLALAVAGGTPMDIMTVLAVTP